MGNLDESTTGETICDVFKDFGIEDARVITNHNGEFLLIGGHTQ